MYLDPFGNFFPDQHELNRRAAERHADLTAIREGRAVHRRQLPRIRENVSSLMSRMARRPREVVEG
ncbi:hypothetical protein [Aeromicrobium sp.]|uniref:hypothetical protein n=1 Tax=Aeromicrobium sp. TaxID=1871063 RepID=UPI003D6BC374